MPNLQDFPDDLKTLIGEPYRTDYIYPEQGQELTALLSEGYDEWLDELEHLRDEQEIWKGAKSSNGILVKKQCEHASCPHFRCERGLRIGGIEI